ncbi:MAG: hypothetical protein M1822_004948 [Bathelium mastoideum]|nr:MAG: hypothetical protein M1822_004948 [Bathelium mastoideum]
MDIDQWLQNTSAPEEKSLAARLGIPSFLQRANPEPASPRHKRKRHRPSRDSSLLEEVVPQQADAPTRQQEAVADPIDSDSHSEISNRSAGTSVSAATSAALYRRRPRRKTKADRYDPKSAKPRKRREKTSDDRKEAKGGKKVRRSREKHGVGLVHTYHTKNVAADRVTVSRENRSR